MTDDEEPLVYTLDMQSPLQDGIDLDEIADFDGLRASAMSPGYKVVASKMEMHLFRVRCFRCDQPFMAWALYATAGCKVGVTWDSSTNGFVAGHPDGKDVVPVPGYAIYIRALPPRVLDFLRHQLGHHPWTKVQASPGQPPYYANVCQHCRAVHGDHYLHLEGTDHQFWPSRADGVRKIEFEPSYLFMFFGLYRPLRPSLAAVGAVLDGPDMPAEGGMMLGCSFCHWAAVFEGGNARPLSHRCSECLSASPFLSAAFLDIERMVLDREQAFFEE